MIPHDHAVLGDAQMHRTRFHDGCTTEQRLKQCVGVVLVIIAKGNIPWEEEEGVEFKASSGLWVRASHLRPGSSLMLPPMTGRCVPR